MSISIISEWERYFYVKSRIQKEQFNWEEGKNNKTWQKFNNLFFPKQLLKIQRSEFRKLSNPVFFPSRAGDPSSTNEPTHETES